ncbi:salicylate hydroxylase [Athelia psychrophila]|uniref:Salicylate hydroxylase n=1 Tax=Athelia psychrophila TaxID=1759441 RepID=A0A166EZC8_9AGAM|nr:salicylate hydroxylase [Fibularhizoctonia sp. CBS 109695]
MGSNIRLRVAICGGGIGGLSCAVALSKYPHIDVDVYEAGPQVVESGPVVGVWLRSWKVLEKLGLARDLQQATGLQPSDQPVNTFNFRKSDGPQGIDFFQLVTRGGLIGFHRADFTGVLLQHLIANPNCHVYPSKQLWNYRQSTHAPIQLSFEDGTSATCDVLVGADGIKSSTRRILMREQAKRAREESRPHDLTVLMASLDPYWSGSMAYRARVDAYAGKNGYILVYPVGGEGGFLSITAFHTTPSLEHTTYVGPWIQRIDAEALMLPYANWEPEVQQLLQCAEGSSQWAIHVSKPAEIYYSGRVALIGDSAHAMEPHQGAGAGQAIEDAYFLATLLAARPPTPSAIHSALRAYDAIRRPFANGISKRNRLTGRQIMFLTVSSPESTFDWDAASKAEVAERLKVMGGTITSNWEWAWVTTVDDSLARAMRLLQD